MIKVAYDLNNFIVLAARLPQIWKNYQVQSQQRLRMSSASASLFTGIVPEEDIEHRFRVCRVRAQVN